MTWILYIWIGYQGHTTMTEHGSFKTKEECIEVGKIVKEQMPTKYTRHSILCIPREKK